MSKIIKFGAEAREQLIEGIDTLANAVVATLGPNGRNAIYSKNGEILTTKDGVSVAKSIVLKDPIQEFGAQLIRQASIKTAEKAGDGTTTSTLIAREIVKAGLIHLNQGINATELKKNIDLAINDVINQLKTISEDISSENQLEQVATISANNDIETGKLITTALSKVGVDGVVHIEESKTGETYLETVEGIQFDRGYKSPYFVTDNNTMTSVLKDPYILITNDRITQAKDLLPILNEASSNAKPILIIADDIDGEALATLLVNKARGALQVCAVKAPDFGDRRKLILEDIAITTGGKVVSKEKGMKLDVFSRDWFGHAKVVTITKENTTIVDGKGDIVEINKRVEELQNQITNSKTPFEKEKLQERLAKMAGGVSIIHVGGNTEAEMKEKKDRVEDALNATKAAIEEGILPGGGVALLHAREAISNKSEIGGKIVYEVCKKPFEQILINAGYSLDNIYKLQYDLLQVNKNQWMGYDIKQDSLVDMKKTGIIDPTKVTRMALQNATSVAGTILLTEVIVADEPEKEKTPDYNSMLGGMM